MFGWEIIAAIDTRETMKHLIRMEPVFGHIGYDFYDLIYNLVSN